MRVMVRSSAWPPLEDRPLTVGINLAVDHHRVPDVAVVRTEWINESEFIEHPPLLVIEVASRSTRKIDLTTKKREYEAFGVESYWIVEPDRGRPSLTAHELRQGRYEQIDAVVGGEAFRAERPFPVTIVPGLLVADGAAWKSGLG